MTAVQCLTTEQVASLFEVKQSTVRRWIKTNRLNAFKIRNKFFVSCLCFNRFSDERLKNRKIKITGIVVV